MFFAAGVAVMVAAGAYVAYMKGVLPLPDLFHPESAGHAGELRPGEIVPLAAQPAPPVPLDPPPTDGVPAPRTETVDIPSPPDPPDRAPEDGLGTALDAGAADAGADAASPPPEELEPPRTRRRRPGRRRRVR